MDVRSRCVVEAVRRSASLLGLAGLSLALASACAEGSAPSEPGGNTPDAVLDMSDASGDVGADQSDGGDEQPEALVVCVLNTAGPHGACADPAELDFGMVSPGLAVTRQFRVDNPTALDLEVTQAAFDTPNGSMSVKPVHYAPQPGSPGSFVRTEPAMPAALAAGQSLWFEVTLVPASAGGGLPASQVILRLSGGPASVSRVEVPLVGQQSGCPMGMGDCDGDPQNGCETDLTISAQHCGSCGAGCVPPGGTGMCVAGQCLVTSCEAGRGDCDGNARNGCETDLTRTTAHCGACNAACSNAQGSTACIAGECAPTCSAGFGDCDGDPQNGCESSLSSQDHCGLCGVTCEPAFATGTCDAGTCQVAACDAGRGDCDGDPANGCEIDTLNEVIHCGACNNLCINPHGTTSCNAGQCAPTCNNGYGDCDGNPQNGCEQALDTNPVCSTATVLSSVRGDSGSDVVTVSGFGERWFRINVREDSSGFCSSDDLCAVFDLTVPPGTDYDLYVYCSDCNGADNSSTRVGTQNESTHVRWEEDTILGCPSGSDSGRDIYVNVTLVSANTCAPYTLTVRGNQCRSGNTCSSK